MRKKLLALFIIMSVCFLSGCSFKPDNEIKTQTVESNTTISPISINKDLENWINLCFDETKTDSFCYSCSGESLENILQYCNSILSKAKQKPCYYSIFANNDIFYIEISFDGILLNNIIDNYSFDYNIGKFMIRTSSNLNEISNTVSEIYGKNTDFSIRQTEITDGNRSYYEVTIIS